MRLAFGILGGIDGDVVAKGLLTATGVCTIEVTTK